MKHYDNWRSSKDSHSSSREAPGKAPSRSSGRSSGREGFGKRFGDSSSADNRGRGFGRPSKSDNYGKRSGSRSGGSGGRNRGSTFELHEVTCDSCGKQCEVPFKPTSSKPVYCRECFTKDARGGNSSQNRSPSGGGSVGISPSELKKINDKLDKIMEALEISR